MRLVFVTGNAGKFREASHELDGIATLEQDSEGYNELQVDTLEEVALAGLAEVGERLAPPFFLEDAGLFVDALKGFPGVYSAYAYKTLGPEGILRLLFDQRTPEDRRAHFEAVIAYRDADGRDHTFTGKSDGTITTDLAGEEGFGFDPVFIPLGKKQTFAQMGLDAKGKVSHRGKAMAAFRKHLQRHPIPEAPAAPADNEAPPTESAAPRDTPPPAAPTKEPATPKPKKTTAAKTPPKKTTNATKTAKTTKTTKRATPKRAAKKRSGEPKPDKKAPKEDERGNGSERTPDGIVTVLDDDDL